MNHPKIKKPVAIVLGGTNPHRALIENLQNRGYYTILVDYLENPPARDAADEHVRESTLDKEIVLQVAKKRNASLVIATCIDQANVTACYVGEKLSLPIPYSHKTALDISDKTTMKQGMISGNIPTSKFIVVKKGEKPDVEDLKFPLVVKPSDSNGSKGVRKANTAEELTQYLTDALSISRNNKAIVEEFVDGDEVGIDCFVSDGKAHVITMHKKRKPYLKDGSVIFSIGSISPPDISEMAKRSIKLIANQIAKVFSLKNTPLLIQAIVNEVDVNVVEFAPRIGGGLNFRKIKLFAGFDIVDAAIDSFLGNKVKPVYVQPGFYYSENHIYTEPGVFGEIQGFKELIKGKVVVDFYPNKTKGMIMHSDRASRDRAASFIVKSNSLESIIDKVKFVIKSIKVLDTKGRELRLLECYDDLLF